MTRRISTRPPDAETFRATTIAEFVDELVEQGDAMDQLPEELVIGAFRMKTIKPEDYTAHSLRAADYLDELFSEEFHFDDSMLEGDQRESLAADLVPLLRKYFTDKNVRMCELVAERRFTRQQLREIWERKPQ